MLSVGLKTHKNRFWGPTPLSYTLWMVGKGAIAAPAQEPHPCLELWPFRPPCSVPPHFWLPSAAP